MRAYTTLLGHILGSHAEIMGYNEKHQSYRSNLGLTKLRFKVRLLTTSGDKPTYWFDKILHNDYKLSASILQRENFRFIYVVRKPEDTLRSIINMGNEMTRAVKWYRHPKSVADYYTARLEKLADYAPFTKGRSTFVHAEDLIVEPDTVLEKLTKFLRLNSPLNKDYKTFTFSGTLGLGDPSGKIKSGEIVQEPSHYEHIQIPEKFLDNCQKIYERKVPFLKHTFNRS